jgi:hypothetical protein
MVLRALLWKIFFQHMLWHVVFLLVAVMVQCKDHEEATGSVVGFWNIYAEGSTFRTIVAEQRRVMESSGLLDVVDMIYYVTMGEDGAELRLSGNKLRHLRHYGAKGSEADTLSELFAYCSQHPISKVLYFHNKGSLNFNTENTNFRRALDCFILNPQCLVALRSGFDTCGWRLSPLPHMHYPGNYWWASCKHVNRLISPVVYRDNQTFLTETAKLYARNKRTTELPTSESPFPDQPYLGLGRYFAETWVTSLPVFRPADCMNASVNNRYMWGKVPLPWRMVNKRCPNYQKDFMLSTVKYAATGTHGPSEFLPYGLPCDFAGFIRQPKLVKKRFDLSSANFTPELRDRSIAWYGQPPLLHIEWLMRFDNL